MVSPLAVILKSMCFQLFIGANTSTKSRNLKIYVIMGGLVEKYEVDSYVGRGSRCAWRVSLASACRKDRFHLMSIDYLSWAV